MAYGIFGSQPGIEPTPPALEAQGFNHWTPREVLGGGRILSYINT